MDTKKLEQLLKLEELMFFMENNIKVEEEKEDE